MSKARGTEKRCEIVLLRSLLDYSLLKLGDTVHRTKLLLYTMPNHIVPALGIGDEELPDCSSGRLQVLIRKRGTGMKTWDVPYHLKRWIIL